MSDRLDELRRQRSLQREHLDWIDREIAALEAQDAPTRPLGQPPVLGIRTDADRDAEAILREYVRPDQSIQRQTRTGCILYLVFALLLLGGVVAAGYVYSRARHGH